MPYRDKEKQKLYNKEYYNKNQEKKRSYGREYYSKNKDFINNKLKKLREERASARKEYRRLWRIKNNERQRRVEKLYRLKNPARIRDANRKQKEKLTLEKKLDRKQKLKYWSLKHNYGISKDVYDGMLLNQGNLCKLCSEEFGEKRSRWPVVDHDHITGEIRGIIHNNCNALLGMAKDSTEILLLAVKYLQESKNTNQEEAIDEPECRQISYN